MGSLIGCCYGCCCCEFNFIIFPSPSSSYRIKNQEHVTTFINSNGQKVPYALLRVKEPKFNIIYFHGNAEDIGYSIEFLFPISQQTKANVYAIQYPCYGQYQRSFGARISTDIKANALEFYDHLSKIDGLNTYNTVVIGRSIGSGGACYLANRKGIKNLVLISPFTTIPKVAKDFAGCIGGLIRTHFNNQEEIRNYKGNLLIIHGKIDEVIPHKHGQQLISIYREKHQQFTFISPPDMSHNYFNMQEDIVRPIKQFTSKYV